MSRCIDVDKKISDLCNQNGTTCTFKHKKVNIDKCGNMESYTESVNIQQPPTYGPCLPKNVGRRGK